MKEQQTAPLTTEELTEKYHKLRRTFILATVISIFGTIVMLPSVLFFKIPYALAGALVLLTGESMRYRIKKEMRALAPWILASGVLNETFEDVRYQPSGCRGKRFWKAACRCRNSTLFRAARSSPPPIRARRSS